MRLAAIFSEHMVLQRNKTVQVFGETDKNAVIRVEIDGIHAEDVVEPGRFVISLPGRPEGGPFTMTVTEFTPDCEYVTDQKLIDDVYFGEVWIDNGQSNIEFEIQNARGGEEELKQADLPLVRYFKSIKTPVIDEAVLEAEQYQHWQPLTDGAFREMSGVAYYFAKKLYGDLKVPIGIVDCYQGGSSISCWLSEERLGKYPEGRIYQEIFEEAVKGQTEDEYDRLLIEYNRLVAEYQERERIAKSKNPDITPEELSKEAGDYPWPPPQGLRSAFRPSGLYHTMLERIAPYTSRGLIYYQGEEDSGKASGYAVLLKELMDEFRTDFMDPKLPIVILQLPMFIARNTEDMLDWAYLREAQEKAVSETEGAVLVSLLDCGEYDNVHPVDKKTPGERTESEVLYRVYGDKEKGSCHFSFCHADMPETGRTVLHFKNTFGALMTGENELMDLRRETEQPDAGHLFGFEVKPVGSEEWIVPKAYIDGETVVLETDTAIDAVRYGFFNYGKVNLYNGKGQPAAPFRSEIR